MEGCLIFRKKFLLLVCLIVSLFDYHSDLNYKGCIVKDEGEMEQIKKRFIVRDKIYQKEYENKHKSSQKRVKVPKKVPKSSHTLIKIKRITFFSHKKRKSSQKQSPKIFDKKAVLPNKSSKAFMTATLSKTDSNTGVFLRILRNF